MLDVKRATEHVIAENKAFVGYPYKERQSEREWMSKHLPNDRTEFGALLESVRRNWPGCSENRLAELISGGSFMEDPGGAETFSGDAAHLEAWGIELRKPAGAQPTSAELQIFDGTWEDA